MASRESTQIRCGIEAEGVGAVRTERSSEAGHQSGKMSSTVVVVWIAVRTQRKVPDIRIG